MAAVIGSVALLLDVNSHHTVVTDQRILLTVVDVVLNLPKIDTHSHVSHYVALSSNKPLESEGEARIQRFLTRGKANSRADTVDFEDAGSSDEESSDGGGTDGNGNDEERANDKEKEMKRRAKEYQDMKELERKGEELQYKIDEEGDDSQEKKRMRVKRELKKVAHEQAKRRKTDV